MNPRKLFGDYIRQRRGTAALEFAFWLAALAVPTFAATDVGYYGYQVIQAHNAAQMAVQAAFANCASTTQFPATEYCGSGGVNLNTAIYKGEESTVLGSGVHMTSGSEKWMCETSTGLQDVNSSDDGTITTKTTGGVTDVDTSGNDTAAKYPSPFNCSTLVTGSTEEPGDYIVVTVQYAFKPVFQGFSVVNLLGGQTVTITQSDYTRLE
jgi:hypothetical protein